MRKTTADLTSFLANMTQGATSVITVITAVGAMFMEPPFVIVPIVGLTVLGYKLALRVMKSIKRG